MVAAPELIAGTMVGTVGFCDGRGAKRTPARPARSRGVNLSSARSRGMNLSSVALAREPDTPPALTVYA